MFWTFGHFFFKDQSKELKQVCSYPSNSWKSKRKTWLFISRAQHPTL